MSSRRADLINLGPQLATDNQTRGRFCATVSSCKNVSWQLAGRENEKNQAPQGGGGYMNKAALAFY